MNEETHNRYFRDIAYNKDPSVDWTTAKLSLDQFTDKIVPVYLPIMQNVYEKRIRETISSSCVHANSVKELLDNNGIYINIII